MGEGFFFLNLYLFCFYFLLEKVEKWRRKRREREEGAINRRKAKGGEVSLFINRSLQ